MTPAPKKSRRSTDARPAQAPPPVAHLGVVVGPDGLARPPWAGANELLRHYYDTEWGVPVRDECGLYERISLEAFQSGLSWATTLAKRPAFRDVFHQFDPDIIAAYDESDVQRLLGDDRIVRNRRKIEATIRNARATIDLRAHGGLATLLWSFQPARSPAPRTVADVPTKTEESAVLARELRRRGFTFVGPTTIFAFMEAIGLVDTHLVDSHRRGCSGLWNTDGRPVRPS